MIRDLEYKKLTKDTMYRAGKVYCKLWDTDIVVQIFDDDVTLEYAEKCAAAMNDMPSELVDDICQAAKLFCLDFQDSIGEDLSEEMTVPIYEDTDPYEILKNISPSSMQVDSPEDPERIGYQLECNCDWEVEHGMEIDILDNKLVFLSEFCGESPWGDHTDESWNYATQI